jgi:hypothetical protein
MERAMVESSAGITSKKENLNIYTLIISIIALIVTIISVYITYIAIKIPTIFYDIKQGNKVITGITADGLKINEVNVTGDVYSATFRIWNAGWVGIPTTEISPGILTILAPEGQIVYHEIISSNPSFFDDSCSHSIHQADNNGKSSAWFSLQCTSPCELRIVFNSFNAGAGINLSIL